MVHITGARVSKHVRFIFDLSAIALPFFLLALAQPHARPAAVLVDELRHWPFRIAVFGSAPCKMPICRVISQNAGRAIGPSAEEVLAPVGFEPSLPERASREPKPVEQGDGDRFCSEEGWRGRSS
jgi:hypothetical protein